MTAAEWSQSAAALASIALMGVCGLRLLRGLGRLLQGREAAWGRPAGALPLHGMAKSGAAMLTSRLLLLAAAYALYRLTGAGSDSFAESFGALWRHWDARHYEGIALEGYAASGDARLRLVFFPLYPWLVVLCSGFRSPTLFTLRLVYLTRSFLPARMLEPLILLSFLGLATVV